MAFEDSNRIGYVEFPYWAKAGVPITATMYGKLTGTATFLTLPSIGIYDPAQPWQGASEDLAVTTVESNTDWQTVTATYTPTYDRELRVRMQGKGGNAGGTGTEKLYWFHTVEGAAGGGGPVIGSRIVRGV
jgi:hypothetical protein